MLTEYGHYKDSKYSTASKWFEHINIFIYVRSAKENVTKECIKLFGDIIHTSIDAIDEDIWRPRGGLTEEMFTLIPTVGASILRDSKNILLKILETLSTLSEIDPLYNLMEDDADIRLAIATPRYILRLGLGFIYTSLGPVLSIGNPTNIGLTKKNLATLNQTVKPEKINSAVLLDTVDNEPISESDFNHIYLSLKTAYKHTFRIPPTTIAVIPLNKFVD
jgi:hypothetical protein